MVGTTELIIILVIVGLLFGASAIPKLAKSIGQARGEFEKGVGSSTNERNESNSTAPKDETKTNNQKEGLPPQGRTP